MVGFSILGTAKSLEMEYVATFLIAIGTFPIVPQDVAWNANNIGGSTKRAVGIAMQIGLVSYDTTPCLGISPRLILWLNVQV